MYQPEQSIENISKKIEYPKVQKVNANDEKDTRNTNKYDALIYGWVSYIKCCRKDFLKYGTALLMFAIEVNDSDLIGNIYKRCLELFGKDLKNNKEFLSIITTSMPLLNKSYPEYITKYSSDTNMIISLDYKRVNKRTSHLNSFSSNIKIVDFTFWLKFSNMFYSPFSKKSRKSKSKESKESQPTITFFIPYIKFSSYPKEYSWWKELIKPLPSPFVKTMNRKIYKTWNGEALINFKWKTYGKYYYAGIWIAFIALLGCFTAATLYEDYEDLRSENIRNLLLIASIILGFIHLFFFEFRQFVYDPIKWIRDPWNYFGKKRLNLLQMNSLQMLSSIPIHIYIFRCRSIFSSHLYIYLLVIY